MIKKPKFLQGKFLSIYTFKKHDRQLGDQGLAIHLQIY